MICIGDLFEGNKLMSWERFRETYAVSCNHLEYFGLVHSLPKQLQKNQPVGWFQQRPILPARLQYLLTTKTLTKFFAGSLMEGSPSSQGDLVRIENKWMRDINFFEPSSVMAIKRSVISTMYMTFQFKLVMRILTTNTFLYIIKIKDNDKCTFCEVESETLAHLFLTCRHVQKFWSDIMRYLAENDIEHITDQQKIFGKIDSHLVTHIATVAKYVIYDSRRNEVHPSCSHFKSRLKQDIETERCIARMHNTVERFNDKWGGLGYDRI